MSTPVSGGAAPDLLSGDAGVAPPATTENAAPETNYVSMEMAQGPGPVPDPDDREDEEEFNDETQSIVSSVLTADGIHDFPGFLCVCMVILLGDVSFVHSRCS